MGVIRDLTWFLLSQIWRKRYVVLFAPSSKGPTRLVKYADEKGFREERQLSFFRMQDVTTVVRLSFNEDHGITISLTGGEVRQFICNDGESWNMFKHLLLGELHKKKKIEKVVQLWNFFIEHFAFKIVTPIYLLLTKNWDFSLFDFIWL